MQAALQFGRLVPVLLTGLANFQSHVGLCSNLVENVALGQVSPEYFQIPFSTSFYQCSRIIYSSINSLNAKLNPICHLLALLGAHLILHVTRIRVNEAI